MAPIIEASGLSKRYQIGAKDSGGYATLRESLLGLFKRRPAAAEEEFWALRDLSFSVQAGERVGVIGRNGAGKSTLLKLLSRITAPSEGQAVLRGRVASLLEVGTGFHRELTGRENIFLNGAILGMSRAEVGAKFDEIVAFAEVERFLDTPVKRYSSGMYMRLAFAVAAHLDPEILVVDEVLAVGDAAFQRKCLDKMEDVNAAGRTIFFVSHNLGAVERLCNRILWLEGGRLREDSRDVAGVLSRYLTSGSSAGGGAPRSLWTNDGTVRNANFVPTRFYLSDPQGQPLPEVVSNSAEFGLTVEGDCLVEDVALNLGFALTDESGQLLFWSCQTDLPEARWPKVAPGPHRFFAPIPKRFLNEGHFQAELILALYHREWLCEPGKNAPAINFQVAGGLSDSPYWSQRRPGLLAPELPWRAL